MYFKSLRCGFVVLIAISLLSCDDLKLSLEKQMNVNIAEIPFEDIGATEVEVSGHIIDQGEGITEYGFCYSKKTGNPDISDSKVRHRGVQSGTYTMYITNLTPNTYYNIRAYLWDGQKAVYSQSMSFQTKRQQAVFEAYTHPISFANNRIELVGSIDVTRGKVIQFGHIWAINDPNNLTVDNFNGRHVINEEITSDRMFESYISSPQAGASYFVKSFATDGYEYKYGTTRQFNYN